jgi:hypothetical protein
MDWNLAIERNREALKRILAMLLAMAGLGNGHSAIASRQSESGPAQAADGSTTPDCLLPTADCRILLPRHLYCAILRLLRPAESAARRLVIVMARGLAVTLPPIRPRKAKPTPTFLRKPGGTGILMPPCLMSSARPGLRTLALPLLDPLRLPFRPRRPAASSVPRISLPGVTAPFPAAPRRPPAPDDPVDATRLALRLQALGAALDDLPRQARRFARWRAARRAGRIRRVWPLRPGRPPGQRPVRRRTHEVHEILNDLHGLAFDVLEHPDTS